MSLLTVDNTPTPPSKERLLEIAVNRIKILSRTTFAELIKVQEEGIRLMWKNPTLTPQEIIDSLGEDAIKVFQFHGGLTDYLQAISTATGIEIDLKYPTNSFTIDQQGNITVTDQPYQP